MVSASQLEHTYRYPFHSRLSEEGDLSRLQLATSQLGEAFPSFFEGELLYPYITAQLLIVVAKTVGTRFFTPHNVLQKQIRARDPVVTAGGGVLRFEGFSVCCGAYARVDLNPDAYRGDFVGSGTTNVDFNPPMRAALAKIRDGQSLGVCVGPDSVSLRTNFGEVVERQVELPLRWLKGFVEVQAYQSTMEKRFDIGKIETIRFLRSLPKNSPNKSSFYVVQSGSGLRLSQGKTNESVAVSGLQRLQSFQTLAPLADRLRIYSNAASSASEWVLSCGPVNVSLAITADAYRGFSGEGQVLSHLASETDVSLAKVRAALKWGSVIDYAELARQCGASHDTILGALARLGSRGLVGYDVCSGAYFHRELPFDLNLIEEMHPRLQAAQKLVSSGGISISSMNPIIEARVRGSDTVHIVRISPEKSTCTCPWFGKYDGSRGPCKHVIAVELHAESHS